MVRPRARWGKPWKRSDVTTGLLLNAIDRWGVVALDVLRRDHGIPSKVLVAAVHRDTAAKFINWGVSPWRPFLDDRGRQVVEEAREVRRVNSQGGRGRGIGGAGKQRDPGAGAGGAGGADAAAGPDGGSAGNTGADDEGGSVHMRHSYSNGMAHHTEGDQTSSHSDKQRCTMCPAEKALRVEDAPTVWGVEAKLLGPGGAAQESQSVTGTPDVVAQWLRALADRLAPPRVIMRGVRDIDPAVGRGFDVLPPPIHNT